MSILIGYDWPGNVRELKNLVESMVVLSPGRVIRPEDIPPEIRDARGRSRLLPVPFARPPVPAENPAGQPELEFIFRTLVQLRVDVEDLRRQFDDYRRSNPEVQAGFTGYPLPTPAAYPASYRGGISHIEDVEPEPSPEDLSAEHDVVVFRPGMSLPISRRTPSPPRSRKSPVTGARQPTCWEWVSVRSTGRSRSTTYRCDWRVPRPAAPQNPWSPAPTATYRTRVPVPCSAPSPVAHDDLPPLIALRLPVAHGDRLVV
jgi:hypothetical protein